ncbi:MAG: hypothetical protein RJA31_1155, partial [Actinomycetota bacterium]
GHLASSPVGHKTDQQFGIGQRGCDSRPAESFSQFGDDLADRRHGYSDSALSWASSSTWMHDSMIGSSAPFITWSRLYALYPVR